MLGVTEEASTPRADPASGSPRSTNSCAGRGSHARASRRTARRGWVTSWRATAPADRKATSSPPFDRTTSLRLIALIRLFLLDAPVETAIAERAIAPTGPRRRSSTSASSPNGRRRARDWSGSCPHGDIVVASDLPDADGTARPRRGHPPSVGDAADLTVRRPVAARSTSRPATGSRRCCRAPRGARRRDRSERAGARFAAFNAALNGVANVESRAGSFFEPVAGSRFELVACNPPYVVSPESEFLFRDSGLARDRSRRASSASFRAFLEDGGYATVLVSWILEGDDSWRGRASGWKARLRRLVLHSATDDAHRGGRLEPDLLPASTVTPRPRPVARVLPRLDRGTRPRGAVLRRRAGGPNWIRESRAAERAARAVRCRTTSSACSRDPTCRTASSTTRRWRRRRSRWPKGAVIESRVRREADGWAEAVDARRSASASRSRPSSTGPPPTSSPGSTAADRSARCSTTSRSVHGAPRGAGRAPSGSAARPAAARAGFRRVSARTCRATSATRGIEEDSTKD